MTGEVTFPDFSLHGKVALVTGGRRGIGRAIAVGLARAGADVAVCSRTADSALAAVAAGIEALGRGSLALPADISRRESVQALVDAVIDKFGRLNVLVNNAGIMVRSPMLELAEADWDAVMSTNLTGYHICAQVVGRLMVQQGSGNIINIASGLGVKPLPGSGAYSIAKAGVLMMTRVLAVELARHDIRVNAISPATIMTEMTRQTWEDPEQLRQFEKTRPLGRVGQPEDIVGAAIFLASPASAYVTGHNIMVDGGVYA